MMSFNTLILVFITASMTLLHGREKFNIPQKTVHEEPEEVTVVRDIMVDDLHLWNSGSIADPGITSGLLHSPHLSSPALLQLAGESKSQLSRKARPAQIEFRLRAPRSIQEGGKPLVATFSLSRSLPFAVTFEVYARDPNLIANPSRFTLKPGTTTANFQLYCKDDQLTNLTRQTLLSVVAGPTVGISIDCDLIDDEPAPRMKITALSSVVKESRVPKNIPIRLEIDRKVDTFFSVTLSQDQNNRVYLSELVVSPDESSTIFPIQVVPNRSIDSPEPVRITASSPGIKPVSTLVRVEDDEQHVMRFPDTMVIPEGGSGITTISTIAPVSYPLRIKLSTKDTKKVEIPKEVTIQPGKSTVGFRIKALNNPFPERDRTFTLSARAESFEPVVATGSIRNNETISYEFVGVNPLMEVDGPIKIEIFATTIGGARVLNPTDRVNIDLIRADQSLVRLNKKPLDLGKSSGTAVRLQLPPGLKPPLRLRASNSKGRSGESKPFGTVRTLNGDFSRLVWDGTRNRLIASDDMGRRLVAINPDNKKIMTTGPATGDTLALAIAPAGDVLYQSFRQYGVIYELDPASLKVTKQYPTVSPSTGNQLYPAEIFPVRGQPGRVLVAMSESGQNWQDPEYAQEIASFRNGIVGSSSKFPHPFVVADTSSASSPEFQLISTNNTIQEIQLDTDESIREAQSINVPQVFVSRPIGRSYLRGSLFLSYGVVLDTNTMKPRGSFSFEGLTTSDDISGRGYYLARERYAIDSRMRKIVIINPLTATTLENLPLPSPVSKPANFIRWGPDGLAFTAKGKLYLVNHHEISTRKAEADIVTEVHATSPTTQLNEPYKFRVLVTNRGPGLAKNVNTSIHLSPGQSLLSLETSQGVKNFPKNPMLMDLGDLPPKVTAELWVTVKPEKYQRIRCLADSLSSASDPSLANNSTSAYAEVAFEKSNRAAHLLETPVNGILYDPLRKRIWATCEDHSELGSGFALISIDPLTGIESAPISLPWKPLENSLAQSPDGRYVFIGRSNVSEYLKMDLNSPEFSKQIVPLDEGFTRRGFYARKFEFLDQSGDHFVILSDSGNTAIMRDGLLTDSQHSSDSLSNFFMLDESGQMIGVNFSHNPLLIHRLAVNDEGVVFKPQIYRLYSNSIATVDVQKNQRLILASNGTVVDAISFGERFKLSRTGIPCVDAMRNHLYLASKSFLYRFDSATGKEIGALPLPRFEAATQHVFSIGPSCIRWGEDGLAILWPQQRLTIARWAPNSSAQSLQDTAANRPSTRLLNRALHESPSSDQDNDGMDDRLESFFGTPTSQFTQNPIQLKVRRNNVPSVNAPNISMLFPRKRTTPKKLFSYKPCREGNAL